MIKKGKSLLALILSLCMLFTGIIPATGLEEVQAATKEITEEQLFMLAPEYLNNEAYNNIISKCGGYALEAINGVSQQETIIASYMYSLQNGTSFLWNQLWSSVGLSHSTYEEFEIKAIKEVVCKYMSVSQNLSKAAKKVDKDFEWIKTTYDVFNEVEKEKLIKDFKEYYPKLTDDERDEMIKTLLGSAGKVMKYTDNGIEAFYVLMGALEMQAIELEALDDLIVIHNQIHDTAMRDALVALRFEITSGIGEYMLSHYLVDEVLKLVQKEVKDSIKSFLPEAVKWSGLSWTLGKLAVKICVKIYENYYPNVSDIITSALLYSYWCGCESTVSHYQYLFLAGKATEDDIRYYEAAVNLDIACLKVLLSKSKNLAKSKNEPLYRRMESWEDALGDSVTYSVYLEGCLKRANQAIKDGTLVISGESATIKDKEGNVIDEKYDSTESIRNRFAAIQSQFRPNVGMTWNGDWGGAIQCFGFARMVFYKLFDCNMPYSYVPDARYRYRTQDNVTLVGQLAGGNVNINSIKGLMQQGKLGDIIQACGATYGQHTMVFVSADDNGVTVYDCNAHMNSSEPDCVIHQWTISWATLNSWYGTGNSVSENGISLYRASNYAQIYGNGDGMFYDDSVNFVIDADGVLTKYNGWQAMVEIPDTVKAIGENAFKNNTTMMSVVIPDSVTSIGANAFSGCTSLIGVTIPDSVETIGGSAFSNCKRLTRAYLPQNSKFVTLNSYIFDNCLMLKEIDIPDTVTTIGSGTFRRCNSLLSVVIPDSVTRMGDEYGSVSNLGAGVFQYCVNLQNVVISKNMSYLGAYSFNGCSSLNNVEIPKSISSVGFYGRPFSECNNLKNVYFEKGITTIIEHILDGCASIESIEIPDTVTNIQAGAFRGCAGLKSVYIPDSVTSIGDDYGAIGTGVGGAFSGCSNLETVHISKGLIFLGAGTFNGCNKLNNVEIPKSITKLGYYGCPFSNCESLKNVTFEKNTIKLMDGILAGCASLEEIEIPDTVEKIGNNVFGSCTKLKKVKIPDSVTVIGDSAFQNCTSLTKMTIPKFCKQLGKNIFKGCSSLEEVLVLSDISLLPSGLLYDCNQIINFDIPNSVTQIDSSVFYNCSNLDNIKIPEKVKAIGGSTFYNCDALTKITIPDSVTSLGTYCFSGCELLKDVELGTGLTKIPQYCFSDCPALETFVVPYRVTTIDNYAFKNDTKLTSVTLPRGLTTIGATEVFSYPDKLTIYGISGTYAQEYADSKNIKFVNREVNAESVKLSSGEITMNKGETKSLIMTVTPANFTDALTWKSTDTNVATVSDTGEVRAVGVGTATIKLTVGNKSASCKVTVLQPVTSISLNRGSLSLEGLQTSQLTAYVYPNNANNPAVVWSSDNEAVATVDANGLVTAVAKGTATIKVTSTDGSNVSASCRVTVINDVHVVTDVKNLESAHDYDCNCKDVWVYTVNGASKINVAFDERTNIEDGFDHLYLYDKDGKQIGEYTGTSLAGQTVTIPGDTVRIRLVSDDSGTEWGFKVTSVTAAATTETNVEGDVTIKGEQAGDVSLRILAGDKEVTVAESEAGSYSISGLSDGTYTMEVSKTNYVTRSYEFTVTGGTAEAVDVELHLIGDIDGDGYANMKDLNRICDHIRGKKKLTDYDFACADINGDGKSVDARDLNRLCDHVRNKNSLWK